MAVARAGLALGVCVGVASVLPTASSDELRLDATATTVPSDRPAPGAEEPATPSSTPTSTTGPSPELAARIGEVLEDLRQIAAASQPEPEPFADTALEQAVAEAIEETVAPPTSTPPSAQPSPSSPSSPTTEAPSTTHGPSTTQAPSTTQPPPATTEPPTTTTATTRPPTTTTTRPRPPVPPGDPQPCSTPGMLELLVDPTKTYFVFDGQSNTNAPDGGNGPNSYPALVMRDLFAAPVPWGQGWINLAVNGTTQTYRTYERTGEKDPAHYANMRSTQVLFNEGGATDFHTGATAQQMIDRTREYVARQRAAGFDLVIQAPTLPAVTAFTEAQEQERRIYHDRLCREYRSLGIDGLVDPTTLPQLLENLGGAPYWADDRIHLTAAGTRLVADEYLRTLRHAG